MNAARHPIAATAEEHLSRFEAWREKAERQSTYAVIRELEQIAAGLRADRPSNFTPFPDPVGEDRDGRRVTEWDFRRG